MENWVQAIDNVTPQYLANNLVLRENISPSISASAYIYKPTLSPNRWRLKSFNFSFFGAGGQSSSVETVISFFVNGSEALSYFLNQGITAGANPFVINAARNTFYYAVSQLTTNGPAGTTTGITYGVIPDLEFGQGDFFAISFGSIPVVFAGAFPQVALTVVYEYDQCAGTGSGA